MPDRWKHIETKAGEVLRSKLTIPDSRRPEQHQQRKGELSQSHVFWIPISSWRNASEPCRYQHEQTWNTTTVWPHIPHRHTHQPAASQPARLASDVFKGARARARARLKGRFWRRGSAPAAEVTAVYDKPGFIVLKKKKRIQFKLIVGVHWSILTEIYKPSYLSF